MATDLEGGIAFDFIPYPDFGPYDLEIRLASPIQEAGY